MVDVKRIVFFPTVNSQPPECWLLHHCLHLCSTANADSGGLFWLGSVSRILPRWWSFISSPSSTKAWRLLYTHHSSSLLDQPSLKPPASSLCSGIIMLWYGRPIGMMASSQFSRYLYGEFRELGKAKTQSLPLKVGYGQSLEWNESSLRRGIFVRSQREVWQTFIFCPCHWRWPVVEGCLLLGLHINCREITTEERANLSFIITLRVKKQTNKPKSPTGR